MDQEKEMRLDSFDAATRRAGLEEAAFEFSALNMHCHSFYSYNGYGYSPSKLVYLAKKLNWRAVGLVDFDVLDGVDEFLAAAKLLGVPAAAGMETRVFVPELADVEINSPGEPGIAYHLGFGFRSGSVPAAQRPFAERLRKQANARTRSILERVNEFLGDVQLDFDAVAAKFTPAGNVTERHLCAAYREAAEAKFQGAELAAFWQTKIGSFTEDKVKLEAQIRSRTMKRGGVGYVAPKPESFPQLKEMNEFILGCGAVPTVAWLNGLTGGEADPVKLLELHKKYGCGAITLIPDRNWRTSDPEKAKQLAAALERFVAAAQKLELPLLAGTEMNAPGQLLADDFTVPALAKYWRIFVAGAESFAR